MDDLPAPGKKGPSRGLRGADASSGGALQQDDLPRPSDLQTRLDFTACNPDIVARHPDRG